jgi:hypothetical protein
MTTMFFTLLFSTTVQASAVLSYKNLNGMKPAATGVVEIVLDDGTSRFESVPFRRHYDNVDFVVNGTDQDVEYIVGYVLWVIPLKSPPMNPGSYYAINGTLEGADYV